MILLFWLASAAAAPVKGTIHFESLSQSYDLVLMDDKLQLRGADRAETVKITRCNREMINKFWKGTVNQIQSLPRVPGAKYKPVLSLDEKFYSPQPFSTKAVRQLDAKFSILSEREKKLCGKRR